MSRHVHDGHGVRRNLMGMRFSPPVPKGYRVSLPVPDTFVEPKQVDVPIYDQIPIVDQGSIGDCTGQATRRVGEAAGLMRTGILTFLSAMFGYSMTRIEEGTPLSEDSGCMIPDAIAGYLARGLCREELWPTIDDGKQMLLEPSSEAKADALTRLGQLNYHAPDHRTIVAAMTQGFGLSVGITCFENMMSNKCAHDGLIMRPEKGERSVGGHNFVLRGWDATKVIGGEIGAYYGDNSWNPGWGCKGFNSPTRGHFYVPRWYVEAGMISEAECVRLVQVGK